MASSAGSYQPQTTSRTPTRASSRGTANTISSYTSKGRRSVSQTTARGRACGTSARGSDAWSGDGAYRRPPPDDAPRPLHRRLRGRPLREEPSFYASTLEVALQPGSEHGPTLLDNATRIQKELNYHSQFGWHKSGPKCKHDDGIHFPLDTNDILGTITKIYEAPAYGAGAAHERPEQHRRLHLAVHHHRDAPTRQAAVGCRSPTVTQGRTRSVWARAFIGAPVPRAGQAPVRGVGHPPGDGGRHAGEVVTAASRHCHVNHAEFVEQRT